jgi:hypothetical protein
MALVMEAVNQLLFAAAYGRFVWAKRFYFGEFTQIVNDDRQVTMIPNFTNPFYAGFGISTDEWGFRRGTHKTNPGCPTIVFIGDSVPFGWGVPDTETLPSKVFDRMQRKGDNRCVINAAIPGFTLFQTIARFEQEIVGKFNAEVVYLQVYDPVSSVVLYGSRWEQHLDWITPIPIHYSASVAIAERALQKMGWEPTSSETERFVTSDIETLNRFRQSVRASLNHLDSLVKQQGIKQLIIAPLTVPHGAYSGLSEGRRTVIEAFNGELHSFAEDSNISFVDTIALLRHFLDVDVFHDDCCHLNKLGNDIVAGKVLEIIR